MTPMATLGLRALTLAVPDSDPLRRVKRARSALAYLLEREPDIQDVRVALDGSERPYLLVVTNSASARIPPAVDGLPVRVMRPELDNMARMSGIPYAQVGAIDIDWVFDRMVENQRHAERLDPLIEMNVADDAFRDAWEDYYDHAWGPFFRKYAGPNASFWDRQGAKLDSDNLYKTNERHRQSIADFDRRYRELRRANAAVPPNAPPAFVAPTTKDTQAFGLNSLPWYVWVGGGVALVGTSYILWRRLTGPLI